MIVISLTILCIYDIIFKEDVITFTLNKLFHGRSDYENSQSQGTKEISEYISHIDDCIEKVNHAILNDQTVPQEAEFLSDELKIEPSVDLKLKHTKIYAKFDLDKDDIRDLGLLVSTYSLDTVKKVLLYIHKNYISKLKKLDCIGALARTLLKDQMFPYNLRPATL